MTEVIGVRFRGGCKEYYFDPHGIAVEAGQFVIVETAQGTEYAQCLTGNHEVDDGAVVRPLRALVRICLLYTSPSPRDRTRSRMPSSA